MNRKEQIKTLWQTCFDDTEASLTYFFNQVYTDEHAISVERDGKIVSVLHMLPYRMQWCGQEIPVSYIYAACTAPEERGKGYMQEVLQKAFGTMHGRGILFTLLEPADPGLYEYYRGHGYTEVFDTSKETWRVDQLTVIDPAFTCLPVDAHAAGAWYPFFDRMMRMRPVCILQTAANFRTLIGETRINEGMVLGVRDAQGEPAGLAFTSIDETNAVYIRDILSNSDAARHTLLREAMRHHGLPSIQCLTPPQLPDCYRMGMGRVINREAMIRIYAAYHSLKIADIRRMEQMDIPTLTAFLMDYPHRQASMSLMPD